MKKGGVTDYREKLFKQTPYDAKTSAEVIDIMEEFGDECISLEVVIGWILIH